MVGIVDYQAGNLRSVETAFAQLGADYVVIRDPERVAGVDRLVFPGVGEARAAMQVLTDSGLGQAIVEFVRSGRPTLGICLGCQIVLSASDEGAAGGTRCLDIVPGRARLFDVRDYPGLKVPHMGWNTVWPAVEHPLFAGIAPGEAFYFVHSYLPSPEAESAVLAWSDYAGRFAAALVHDNLVATQFHPEKSGPVGLHMLRNFLDWR